MKDPELVARAWHLIDVELMQGRLDSTDHRKLDHMIESYKVKRRVAGRSIIRWIIKTDRKGWYSG